METFGLRWPGRDAARRASEEPARGALVVDPDSGHAAEDAIHAVIEGDNLDVMRLLRPVYRGRVQLAFLDPPYNTGRNLAYADRFREPSRQYLARSGQTDDPIETRGRLHANWLSFMRPRLALVHELLAPTGFCVVTIDDGEVAVLRLLLDEIFGEDGFVAHAVWQKAYVANQTAKHLSNTHDHVLIYARDAAEARSGRLPRSPRQLAAFRNPDDDPRGPWKAENLSAGKPYSKGTFVITTPEGRTVRPPPGRWWRCSEERYRQWAADGRIWFGKDGRGRPMLKKYLSEVRAGLTPDTWWTHEDCGSNKEASTHLKALFHGRAAFDTPKPVRLLERIVTLFCPDGGLVLDPFAGSGTTGHAVLEVSARDGKRRPFVLVQLPEPTAEDALPTLAHVCRERLRRACAERGGGFRALRWVADAPDAGDDGLQALPET